ncbi:MAG: radical SAM protein [Candidatus Thorarchaeota archaeon]
MRKVKIIKSKEQNYYIKGRGIPKGCKLCLKGLKTVFFINGVCQKPDHCSWYCPISSERKEKDSSFANEIMINSKEELLEEINKVEAHGISITGGEPLSEMNYNKTIEYIKYIKTQKGKKFHIHLYTNGVNFNENMAEELLLAGLDEIRFHPDKEHWMSIKIAIDKGLIAGAEIPVIPNRDSIENLKELIIYLDRIKAYFVNLNEFEYCFPNSESLKERGFYLEKGSIASVVNSRQTAFELIKDLGKKISLKIHFCSITAKDYYQLKRRYLRRAKNIRLPFEVITEEGLLVYGQLEGKKEDLDRFYLKLISEMNIDKSLLHYSEDNLKLPFYIAIDNKFLSVLENSQLDGYIIEMTPFRIKEYQQITEKTPIKLYKKEFGHNAH